MAKNKITKGISILLTLIILFSIIDVASPVLGIQADSDMIYNSESNGHAENYIENEIFEEIVFQSELYNFSDFGDISTESISPVIYEWICESLPMFGYDPEIDPVDFSDLSTIETMAANQVTAHGANSNSHF